MTEPSDDRRFVNNPFARALHPEKATAVSAGAIMAVVYGLMLVGIVRALVKRRSGSA
jgi:hypothetical protein